MKFFKSQRKKQGPPLRALHIDDSQWVRIPVSVLLRRHFGMKVYEAGSGPEGLLLAERERPDVIILDVMMPNMDGFDTLVKLKENPKTKSIPVLMCTARDLVREVNMAVRLGAVAYLTKPIEEDILIEKVKNILTATGKWGQAAVKAKNPFGVVPDPQVDFVIPKEQKPARRLVAEPAAAAGTSIGPKEPLCSFCQKSLSFIEQYGAWYCYPCRKYPDLKS